MDSNILCRRAIQFDFTHPNAENDYLLDHTPGSHAVLPAASYIMMAWESLDQVINGHDGQSMTTLSPVVVDDFELKMPVIISRTSVTTVEVTLIPETGEFRVTNRGRLAAKGVISVPKGPCLDRDIFPACFVSQVKPDDVTYNLTSEDIYAELRSRGYNYGPGFELLLKADNTDTMTKTTWTGSWLCLMEAMLQTFILSLPGQQQLQRIRSIKIDPKKMPKVQGSQSSEICCLYDRPVDIVVTDGVEMRGVGVMPIATGSAVSTIASVIFSNGFYPFLENVPEIIPPFLQKYAEDCIKFCMQEFTKLMAMNTTDNTAAQRDLIREILLEQKIKPASDGASLRDYQNSNNCSLAQMLVKLFALAGSGTMSGEVPQLVDQMSDALNQDCLLSSLCSPEILAPCLEIVKDNVRGSELNILEIDAHDNKFYKHALPLLQSTGNKSVQYNVMVSKDANMMDENKMIRVLNTDPRTDSLEQLNKQNLIVLANYLNKHSDVDAILAKISALIDRNGYLLVTETTDNQLLYYMKSLFTSQPENVKNGRIYGRFFNVPKLEELFTRHGLQVVYRKSDSLLSTLFLLKRRQISQPTPKVVIVNSEERLFGEMIKSEIDKVILSARKDEDLWIMTASKTSTEVSAMLTWLRTKTESDLERVRFAVVTCLKTTAALENIRKSPGFTRIMEMDQIFNVYRDGVWGVMSSFSKTLDPMSRQQPCMYAHVTSSRPGDLSSLTWVESPLKYQTSENGFANVHYSSLNFKDIMIASGKIPSDLIDGETGIGEARVGIEWSGVDSTGRRLAGMVLNKGYATAVMVYPPATFSIPDHWTMEEAATIPIAYITAYHGLITVGNIQPGESVLIHCGAGALGQACIRIAISRKCEVFTTVGSQEKREFLKKMFPSLTDRHFANSRNLSFEFDILNATKGRGVDVVVNSLAGRSLQAGLRVLAQNGRFVEVGKRDVVLNTPIGMSFMRDGAGIQAYFVDRVPYHCPSLWERTRKLTQEGIDNGVVQPLKCHVFTSDQTTDAFRLMESGKHTGKIVIKIRDEVKNKAGPPAPVRVMAITKTYCHPQKCYIVVGGLGGFGRNMADWLVQRGAKKLVLCGSGHEQGYWRRRHQTWTSKGASVCFCDGNLDMAQLLNTVSKLGSVGAIFDVNRFQPKTITEFSISPDKMTEDLEMATKDFPGADVDHFVVLASAGPGGDSGSTDSSLSTAGTVCERRKANGKHGLLLQFDMTKERVTRAGHQCTGQSQAEPRLEPKTVALCMETLDHLLCQSPPCAVVKCSLS